METARITARFAGGRGDLARAQRLRHAAFAASGRDGRDADGHDAACRHVLVEGRGGDLLCTFRLLWLRHGGEIGRSYAARHYDLAGLAAFDAPMLEIGRFCLRPDTAGPDILRVAWGVIARVVEDEGVRLLFGCSSFPGTDPAPYRDAFALLAARHLAPRRWLPGVRAPQHVRFPRRRADPARALRSMPPLLRFYLSLGGWVSDHAVIDRHLGTLHVFTGVETVRIPPALARFLRAGMAGAALAPPRRRG